MEYLNSYELKELRADVKRRGGALAGTNSRASVSFKDGFYTLTSYYTDVCSYNPGSNTFIKLWDGYSATTMKHIDTFLDIFNKRGFNKRDWIALDCNMNYTLD